MAVNKEELMETIENMTVLELSELVKALEERFGVSATAVAAAPVAGAAGDGAAPLPKKSRPSSTSCSRPRREEDPGHKGPRSDRPRPEGGQGLVDEAPNPVKEALSRRTPKPCRTSSRKAGATRAGEQVGTRVRGGALAGASLHFAAKPRHVVDPPSRLARDLGS